VNSLVRLVYRNFRSTLDTATLFFELVFPLFFIFIQGFAFTGIIPDFMIGGKSIRYPVFLAAGAVTLTIINGGTTAGQLLWFDRKNGMFEQILMGPFTRAQYILSIIASTILIGALGAALVFLIALPVLQVFYVSLTGFLYTAIALILGSLFFGALAIALSVRLRSSETFQVVSTFLFFVFLFTSSVFYPAEKAPVAIQTISYLNPLTYITDIFRAGLLELDTPLLIYETTALVVLSIAMFVIAVLSFNKIKV
jgi:ABC-2 type transport system permease protein